MFLKPENFLGENNINEKVLFIKIKKENQKYNKGIHQCNQ